MFGGLGSMMMQGMAMGTGSAIAHRAVDGVMGPRQIEMTGGAAPVAPAAVCTPMHSGAQPTVPKCSRSAGVVIVASFSGCRILLRSVQQGECRIRSGLRAALAASCPLDF